MKRLPLEVRQWANEQIAAIEAAPDAAAVSAGAFRVKGAPGLWVRKFRRKPHGHYRLVFFLSEDAVKLLSCDSRQDDYKTALRRAK